jgi:hypothetical protein
MAIRKNTVVLKRSNVVGKVPSNGDLLLGELAINVADVKLYASGTTANSIIPIGWDRISRTGDTVTGNFYINGLISATTISATTYYGNGSNLTGIANAFTGGTVTGPTTFTNGLTANTISATTYLNIPSSTFTGGTVTGPTIFTDGLSANTLQFNSNPTVTGFSAGRIYYDSEWKTMAAEIDDSVTLQIGQEELVYVYNNSGVQIPNGSVVYVTGAGGTTTTTQTIAMTIATSSASTIVLGITTETIENDGYGYVTVRGNVNELNTTLYGGVAGDELYLSDGVLGGLTTTKPISPSYAIRVGRLLINDAVSGRVSVSIINKSGVIDSLDVLNYLYLGGVDIYGIFLQTTNESKVTGFAYSANTLTINNSLGNNYSVTINTFTGLTVAGQLSATTYLNLPTDVYTTGGTYSNGTATYRNNTGGTFTVTGFVTGDTYVTGGTYSNGTATYRNNTGGTFTVTGFVSGDTYVTGVTNSAGTLTIKQNNGIANITADTKVTRELIFNSNDITLNTATRVTLTPLVMVVTRFNGSGATSDAGISFITPDDYHSEPDFYFTWRTTSTGTTSAKTYLEIYTGSTSELGSLVTPAETLSLVDVPNRANTFLFSPTVRSAMTLSADTAMHIRIYRNPADVGDTFTGSLDMINFVFKYKSIS